jgi:pSer/pThr/pTyr-binding forkhead associated (FHA) protein
MAKLFWLQPDSTIVEFPLPAEQNVIGRGGRSDIRIKHPGISAEHAMIRIVDEVATIEDLNSTNGTRVNGRAVQRHTLRHGDQIEVGRERLMYFAELDSASRFAQPEPNVPYSEPGAQAERVTTTPSPMPPVVAAKASEKENSKNTLNDTSAPSFGAKKSSVALSAYVAVLSGANAGKRFPLDKPTTTLGKEGRQVIVIERVADDLWCINLKEGATPPYINGDAIIESRPLASGDVIELTGIKLRFEIAVGGTA